ncbi:3'-5' exonuclease [Salinisphaera sp. P385]|uniref:DNA-directed DNA polymerase n=1 Tax=Spectribacter acetivorans TaxID=3075603 RepID=A0ABU3B948_9GAMM|nr:3'-5' exonuclease [Salinisphaera sp. P385]MDT0618984.1 3'-5' exonuclease [Salinisphaera sp. P385]
MRRLLDRLRPWRAGPPRPLHGRLVVVDTETTGLDPRRAALLSVGAVSITGGRLDLDDGFYQLADPERVADPDNILVHRLTPEALAAAPPAGRAAAAFRAWRGDAPLFAYHAAFDRCVLDQALVRVGEPRLAGPVIDVADWVCLAEPEFAARPPTLDAAAAFFRLPLLTRDRHNAHADALVTALLLLRLAARRPFTDTRELARALRRQRLLRAARH